MATYIAEEGNLNKLVAALELPDRAYELAAKRYQDLGEWLARDGSSVAAHNPHVFVQGSFALGTAIRPLMAEEQYDLDLSCKFRLGVSRATHTQKQVKDLLGKELEAYRRSRGIEQRLEAKHRCWRLQYKDEIQFHMDVVPAIAAEDTRRKELSALMENVGVDRQIAADLAVDAVWITDDRKPNYQIIDWDWPASNPEGYVRWFKSRMEGSPKGLKVEARVDDVPTYRRKTPLQRAVQLLKRHRDVMFNKNPDAKPISIIISTIAANAYVAGESLTQSMHTVLNALAEFRRSDSDVVLNPVNPKENFADRWKQPEGIRLHLKRNFHLWVDQVSHDFKYLAGLANPQLLAEQVSDRFGVALSAAVFAGLLAESAVAHAPNAATRRVEIPDSAPQPWRP